MAACLRSAEQVDFRGFILFGTIKGTSFANFILWSHRVAGDEQQGLVGGSEDAELL
jgi:hypothetical protein